MEAVAWQVFHPRASASRPFRTVRHLLAESGDRTACGLILPDDHERIDPAGLDACRICEVLGAAEREEE